MGSGAERVNLSAKIPVSSCGLKLRSMSTKGSQVFTDTTPCGILFVMSELSHGEESENLNKLGGSIANIVDRLNVYKHFLGYKSAHEVLEELGFLGKIDENGETALIDAFATMISCGITLSVRSTTRPEDIEAEESRLMADLPPQLRELAGSLLPYMLQRGIDFYHNELVPATLQHVWQQTARQFP